MADSIADVMNSSVHSVTADMSLREAAEIMRDGDVGDVVVTDAGRLLGILTDRDIVVRCVAEGADCGTMRVRDAYSSEMVTIPRQSGLRDAVHAMRTATVRRLPVVEGEDVVGVVSMGDLARAIDEESALAEVSSAAPNR